MRLFISFNTWHKWRQKPKGKKNKTVTFLPFPLCHKTICSSIWTLNFIYSTRTTTNTQCFWKMKAPYIHTNCATTPTALVIMNWKQKPWYSSLNTLILKPKPILALCGLGDFGVQGFREVKISLSRQTELVWSERKQAAMSRHSQLYCFTLQPILCIWMH